MESSTGMESKNGLMGQFSQGLFCKGKKVAMGSFSEAMEVITKETLKTTKLTAMGIINGLMEESTKGHELTT